MNQIFFLLLTFRLVFCKNCSQQLFEKLNFTFDLSKSCDDTCVNEQSLAPLSEWLGHCSNNKLFFVQESSCHAGTPGLFVQVTNGSCLLSPWENLKLEGFDTDCLQQYAKFTCEKLSLVTTDDLRGSAQPLFQQKPAASIPFASNPDTQLLPTTSLPQTYCEEEEILFQHHCYFSIFLQTKKEISSEDTSSFAYDRAVSYINSTAKCAKQHPNALGLAVETELENDFILNYLKESVWNNRSIVLSSGIKPRNGCGIWRGWNKPVDPTIVKVNKSFGYYAIDVAQNRWFLDDFERGPYSEKINLHMMCERHYNPKNIVPFLYLKCLEAYRRSKCYDKKEHKKFCCAKDERNDIWFGCPGAITERKYPGKVECTWRCGNDGFFLHEYPICTGRNVCRASYKNLKYSAPANAFAISNCPASLLGYSTWYCGANGTFQGLPDFSFCCENFEKKVKTCVGVDKYLKLWMGCPGRAVVKRTDCPPGSEYDNAYLRWYCSDNGTFVGFNPDYSSCNGTEEIKCVATDRYGIRWEGSPEETIQKNCPPSYIGFCYWKCLESGQFETPEPDYTGCRPTWIDEVDRMISNGVNHQEVMEAMDNFTSSQDLRLGFGHVLNLTLKCVHLFKSQSSEGELLVFEKFLLMYSKILKNIAGDAYVWSAFSPTRRVEYGKTLVATTQNASFANLRTDIGLLLPSYNITLASFKNHGFDFFVKYSSKLTGSKFPLDNYEDSDWQLEVKRVNESKTNFAAMGLVLDHSISSLVFPQNNNANNMLINSQVLTFTIASIDENGPAVVPDVTVYLSFKHINKTRFPRSKVIRRKLHDGETPSGIFNSTMCFYYEEGARWRREGCVVTYSSKEETNCTCHHLSTIGLLMSVHEYVADRTLEMVSLVSSSITIVSLSLALFVFYVFDSVKNERLLIGKNLCFCLLVGHVMLICVFDKKFFYISDNLCTIYAVLLHYVFMAAFAWMFVEGCHLYRMLVFVFDSNIDYRYIYLLIGYGVPLIVVGVTELIGFFFQEQPYGQDELCWLKAPNYIWAFIGPVVFSTSINFLILLIAMKLAISSKMKTEKSTFSNLKVWLKGWISLSTLLGVTWLLGLAYTNYNEVCVYTFVVLNGLQGLFIFLFRCLLTEQYKTAFLQKLKLWFPYFAFTKSKAIERVKTDSKIFVISHSGSKFTSEAGNSDSGYDAVLKCLSSQIDIQKGILKTLGELSASGETSKENCCSVGIDIGITVTPAASEEYLRRNVVVRKNYDNQKIQTKQKSQDFPELSYHINYHDK